jgi:hypothetical protein
MPIRKPVCVRKNCKQNQSCKLFFNNVKQQLCFNTVLRAVLEQLNIKTHCSPCASTACSSGGVSSSSRLARYSLYHALVHINTHPMIKVLQHCGCVRHVSIR